MTYPIRTLRAKWIGFLLCMGLWLVWSGCAVPVPLSERTVFRAAYPDWEQQRTVGLTATLSTARSEVQRYVQQRFEPAGPDDDVSVWTGAVLRGSVSLGYVPALDAPVVRFGIAVYGFQ